jgi:hypothetical protein
MTFEYAVEVLSEGTIGNSSSRAFADMRVTGKLLIRPLEEAYALTVAELITYSSIDITTHTIY